MDNGVGRWDDKYGHAHCECGLGKHDCCDEPPGDHIRQGVEQQQALVARLQEAEAEKQAMPAHLAQRSSDWLSSNEKQPAEVRWGRFPLGMVQRWVERAEIAEARLQEAEAERDLFVRIAGENGDDLNKADSRLQEAEKVMLAFEEEEKAGRFSCECEWAPDEYTTQVRECVTHAALHEYRRHLRTHDSTLGGKTEQ